jgi:2-polyprenyl-3-methyl-5-hydroxy-6-metoxy-1,4-benzoquinol methylase
MRFFRIPACCSYLGIDIVKSVIETKKQSFTRRNVHFKNIKSNEELVNLKAHVLICKEVLQHWSI